MGLRNSAVMLSGSGWRLGGSGALHGPGGGGGGGGGGTGGAWYGGEAGGG
jgi:hypothetical protein